MVYFMENPLNPWMIWGENPIIFGNTHINHINIPPPPTTNKTMPPSELWRSNYWGTCCFRFAAEENSRESGFDGFFSEASQARRLKKNNRRTNIEMAAEHACFFGCGWKFFFFFAEVVPRMKKTTRCLPKRHCWTRATTRTSQETVKYVKWLVKGL